jgi:hypothetical protein
MRRLALTVFSFASTIANAQVYTCPQTYPGNDRPAASLTSATMAWGEIHGTGLFAGDYSEAAQDGFNLRFPFMEDQQAWLVCSYGSKKRNRGQLHKGREWNQYMEWTPTEWWIQVAPKVRACDVQVREISTRVPGKSTWTATAVCEHQ